ncbi:uridine diphosphate glucose pyrophosphatase NUDT14 isoform X3 [Heterodontus francisci]|uniref:uridine diphosphate glucose pyrophosphatase NUDT14 isoform X3 n=1 Tax=Heterodontus francisci TaxID=7792 RepID=UPI00355C5A3F
MLPLGWRLLMETLSEVEVGPCRDSQYLRPLRVHYTQNGTRKHWDFMKTHDSVSILIFNSTRESFILVKQFRPAVYMCECVRRGILPADITTADCSPQSRMAAELLPASAGVTYELCAGIVDKPGLSLQEIAQEEILEECGYNVSVENLQKITSYRPERIWWTTVLAFHCQIWLDHIMHYRILLSSAKSAHYSRIILEYNEH